MPDISYIWNSYLAIVGIVTALLGFISWLTVVYTKISNAVKIVDSISKEFKPNGGSSIKDILNRTEKKVCNTEKKVCDIDNRLDKIEFMTQLYWDRIDTPIFICGNNGKYVWANKAYLTLVESPLSQLVGTGWELTISKDEREMICDEWYRACNELRPCVIKYSIVTNSDKLIHVKCESHPLGKIKTGDEVDIGYIGFLTVLER